MTPAALAAYDQSRDFSKKAVRALCYAPFAALYFCNNGDVRVCCHNWKHTAGNILQNNIDEIWHSARVKILRDALKNYQFGPGCEFCQNRTDQTFANSPMRRYDRFTVPDEAPQWPQLIELSISNSCNLECVMCYGQYSSTIRARREKMPPIPRLYGDAFFESLWKYLPHLNQLKFLGGEPFLISEYYRLWDRMMADGLAIQCHVTTNGTQYNSRIERILDSIPMSFSVSMDAATKATYEGIRVNAKYEEVMENIQRYREHARKKKTSFGLTFCLMKQNWHELGDYCLLADSWDCNVWLNMVNYPPGFGIYTLPIEEQKRILAGMEAQAPRLESSLKKNRAVWFGELERLRAKCGRIS